MVEQVQDPAVGLVNTQHHRKFTVASTCKVFDSLTTPGRSMAVKNEQAEISMSSNERKIVSISENRPRRDYGGVNLDA